MLLCPFRVKHPITNRCLACDPTKQAQDANFSSFDPTLTLANLINANNGDCVQGQALRAGLSARCFNILDVDKPSFIANFFAAIADSTAACESVLL